MAAISEVAKTINKKKKMTMMMKYWMAHKKIYKNLFIFFPEAHAHTLAFRNKVEGEE